MIKQFFNVLTEFHQQCITALSGKVSEIVDVVKKSRQQQFDNQMESFTKREKDEAGDRVNEDRDNYKKNFETETNEINKTLDLNAPRVKGDLQLAMDIVARETGLTPQIAFYESAVLKSATASNLLALGEITNGNQVAVNKQFQDIMTNRGSKEWEVRAKKVNWTTAIVFAVITAIAFALDYFIAFAEGWNIFMLVVKYTALLGTAIAYFVTRSKVPPYVEETQTYTHKNLLDIAFAGKDQKYGVINILFPNLSNTGKEVIATMVTRKQKLFAIAEEDAIAFDLTVLKESEKLKQEVRNNAGQPLLYTVYVPQDYNKANKLSGYTKENIVVFLYGYPYVENLVKYEVDSLSKALTDTESKELLDITIKCHEQFNALHNEKLHQAFKGCDAVRKAYLNTAYELLRNMSYLKNTNTVLALASSFTVKSEEETSMYASMKKDLIKHSKEQLSELTKIIAEYAYANDDDMNKIESSLLNLKATIRYKPEAAVIEKGSVIL